MLAGGSLPLSVQVGMQDLSRTLAVKGHQAEHSGLALRWAVVRLLPELLKEMFDAAFGDDCRYTHIFGGLRCHCPADGIWHRVFRLKFLGWNNDWPNEVVPLRFRQVILV
jgi:hypothetical protein